MQDGAACVFRLGYSKVLPRYVAALLGDLPPPVKVLPALPGYCVDDAKVLNPSEK